MELDVLSSEPDLTTAPGPGTTAKLPPLYTVILEELRTNALIISAHMNQGGGGKSLQEAAERVRDSIALCIANNTVIDGVTYQLVETALQEIMDANHNPRLLQICNNILRSAQQCVRRAEPGSS